jgi:5-formyltetrahydrofolate cyclo-ligase
MKQTLKQEILDKRKKLDQKSIEDKNKKIKNRIYSILEFKKSKNILFYVSLKNEVNTYELIKELLNEKEKTVLVPYVLRNNPIMQVSELHNFEELEPKSFDILEPKDNSIREFNPGKIDLVIVPGVVFDLTGHRIGYGYAYYDRFLKTLKQKPIKIGLAYDFQIVDKIPEEQHDIPMDIILTEERAIECNQK